MKVLHVVQGYAPAVGGTEWLIQRVSEELVRQFDDDVTVFTTNCYGGDAFYNPKLPRLPIGEEMINGVRVRRFGVRRSASLGLQAVMRSMQRLGLGSPEWLRTYATGPIVPGLPRAIRQSDAQLVAASSFPLVHMFDALRAAHASGRPCVLHGGLHPEDRWGFDRQIIYRAMRQADHYIANTGYEAGFAVQKGVDAARVTSIGVGVDADPFLAVDAAEARARLGLGDEPVIGFIGQIVPHKGADTLLQAMPRVWQVFPRARVLIGGFKRKFADRLEEIIQGYPEADRAKVIRCYNFELEQKPWLFAAVDVFAYPSALESFGIAFLEAWGAGKPVIGCRRGAIPWVVDGGRDGLLVEYGDAAMLAQAVISLLQNPSWAQALGAAGRKKTLENYTWPVIARRFRQVYAQAVLENEVRHAHD